MNWPWKIRSKWDYLCFIVVAQWFLMITAAIAGLFSFAYSPLYDVAILALVASIAFNFASPLVVFSTWLGSRHHDHMDPGIIYHLAAIFFAPIVGIHYLYRTKPLEASDSLESGPIEKPDSGTGVYKCDVCMRRYTGYSKAEKHREHLDHSLSLVDIKE